MRESKPESRSKSTRCCTVRGRGRVEAVDERVEGSDGDEVFIIKFLLYLLRELNDYQ